MPVGAWNIVYPSSVSTSTRPSQSGVSSRGYTANQISGVSYGVGGVNTSTTVSAATWNNFVSTINSERLRRNQGGYSLSLSNPISAAQFNSLRSGIQVGSSFTNSQLTPTYVTSDNAYNGAGQGENVSTGAATYPPASIGYTAPGAQTSAGAVAGGGRIYPSNVNALINDINNAGAACVCNCNYCSCNCNYCVCNCNYTCTCNCNYSDERLKENIKLIGNEEGLNVYSYTYIWDNTKKFIGVLAQELLGTKYENALIKASNGYYAVDYSKLPVKFKEA